MKRTLLVAVPFLLLAVFAYATTAGGESSCVTCHTSDSVLKSLVKPPDLAGGEGEG